MPRLVTLGGLAVAHDGDPPPARPPIQRRQLALLAVLARAGESGVPRERLAALLWPEREDAPARALLDQAVYAARRTFGRDGVRSLGAAIALAREVVPCDVVALEEAARAGALERAAALYAGPFLDGVHLADAPEFERWATAERTRVAALALDVLRTLARRADDAGDRSTALDRWRAAASLDPLDAAAALGLVGALAAGGDVPGALRQAHVYEQLLRAELDAEPPAPLRELVERLRRGEDAPVARGAPGAPAAVAARREAHAVVASPAPLPVASPGAAPDVGKPWVRWQRAVATGLAVAAGAAVLASSPAARLLRGSPPAPEPAAGDPVAAQFLVQGTEAYRQGDAVAARRLLHAAVDRDSALAIGWYYLARIEPVLGRDSAVAFMRRAVAAARRAPRHDRLLVEAAWTAMFDDPDRLGAARRFVREYPSDPAAARLMGEALSMSGDFLAAVSYLRTAIRLDSASLGRDRPACEACDAYAALGGAYGLADSVAAAARVAREWLRAQPRSPYAWRNLGAWLVVSGRVDEGLAAYRRASELPLGGDQARAPFAFAMETVEANLRAGRLAEAARRIDERTRDGPLASRLDGFWFQAILLRIQGRPAEAGALAGRMRGLAAPTATSALPYAEIAAQSLLEAGAYREAAALFDSSARLVPTADLTESSGARWRAWMLTHAATALAAAGDTAPLAARADSIERLGQRTGFGRDQRLHHYVRGLLLAARGNHAGAAAEYRAAIFSAMFGFTRVNLELARALLALDRPREAVETLQSALRGGVEASNLYVTRTELHEALGDAWSAAGRGDSARVHYAAVADAWRDAEPRFRARWERARRLAGPRAAPGPPRPPGV